MAMKRLATLDSLRLPLGDEVYEIPPVDADLGLFLTEFSATLASVKSAQDDGDTEYNIAPEQIERLKRMSETFNEGDTLERMLGPGTYDSLKADGVPWATIQIVAHTVMIWTVSGEAQAEEFWNTGGRPPKGRAPQDRKPKKKTSSRRG
jgi:hypothetical protein